MVAAIALFLISYYSRQNDYLSDPRLNLTTAQALVEHGHVYLDDYRETGIHGYSYEWYLARGEMVQANGHYYDYFPLGTAVLSAPAVYIAHALGQDMTGPDNLALQRLLSSLTVAATFLALCALARTKLGWGASLLMSFVFTMGSSLLSSMGSALWSLNYCTLAITLALLLIARRHKPDRDIVRYLALGGLLFIAYLTRASAASFVGVTLVYLALTNRRAFALTAASSATLLCLFVAWSLRAYGTWLPPYYMPVRISSGASSPFYVGFLGHLFSPSRGLFVFSPFLLLTAVAYIVYSKRLLMDRESIYVISWILLHIAISSQSVVWWGGWSFGPRLLTETIPGWLLITATAWNRVSPLLTRVSQVITMGTFLLLGALAALIHGVQGLYNPLIHEWNALVNPVPVAEYEGLGDLFKWQYSQLLLSDKLICRLEHEQSEALVPYDRTLRPYAWGEAVRYSADLEADWRALARGLAAGIAQEASTEQQNLALFIGFHRFTSSHIEVFSTRPMRCSNAHVIIGPTEPVAPDRLVALELDVSSRSPRRVRVYVNDVYVGEDGFTAQAGPGYPVTLHYLLKADLLRSERPNIITLELGGERDRSIRETLVRDPQLEILDLHELRLFVPQAEQDVFVWQATLGSSDYASEAGAPGPLVLIEGNHFLADAAPIVIRQGTEPVLEMSLAWGVGERSNISYKSYLHLVDSHGAIVAQDDPQPAAWGFPMTAWPLGEPVWIRYALPLPADLAPGQYRLYAGLSHPETLQRLGILSSDLPSDEHGVLVGQLELDVSGQH